ncbi:MAG: hypothetical protein WC068_12975 [Caulobacter sp.]
MWGLIRAEWLRFHRWALVLGMAHLGWLLFADRVADPLRQQAIAYKVYLGILALLGMAFGLYQVSAYARQAAWIDLLHRPVAPRRIGAALLLTGLALTCVAVALPVALLLPFHHVTAGQGVESRHLLFPLAAWAVGATGYLLGVHLRLGPPRLAFTATILLVWLYQAQASGPAAAGLQVLAAGIAFLLALGDFRPDRTAPDRLPRRMATSFVAALAIGVVGTFALRFALQIGLMLVGNHPLNGVPPAGGLVEAMRADGAALMASGLASRPSERNRFWSEQAGLSEVVTIVPELRDATARFSLTSPGDSTIEDDVSRLVWSFSHDTMRYAATSMATRRPWKPELSPPPLPVPPLVAGDGQTIIAGNRILQYEAQSSRFSDRITLPPGERLIAPPQPAWDQLAILSDHALRVYDGRVMRHGDGNLPPLATVDLAGPPGALVRIDMLELLDGYLVSFTYGQRSAEGWSQPEQQLWLIEGARVTPVLRRPLDPDYPAIMRHADLWFAPVLTSGAAALRGALGPPNVMADTGPRAAPSSILALALLLHILSALGAWWRGGRVLTDRRERVIWATAALFLGPPMLIAFLLLHRRKAPC